MVSEHLQLSINQTRTAVESIIEFIKSKTKSHEVHEESDAFIRLIVSLKKPQNSHTLGKPKRLTLPYPIYSKTKTSVCLFVKDSEAGYYREKTEYQSNIKIIGMSKLHAKYDSFVAKRRLSASYEIFLADDRLIPILPRAVGKGFFQKKKQPIPVRISMGNSWSKELSKAIAGTHLFSNNGNCISIKIGRAGQTCDQLIENIVSVVEQMTALVPGNWSNLQGLFLRAKHSISLPIYQSLPLCKKVSRNSVSSVSASMYT